MSVTAKSSEEAFAQIYACTFKFIYDSTLNFIELYDDKCKMLRYEITMHEENKPFKIFKKAYKIWQEKRYELNLKYEKAFNDLMKEYQELEEMLEIKTN
ncbi:MAG: hypothetical protein HFJ02_03610 [Bacilli bacterium]|nr:hypothetical protein [Bacilli bacterium]